MKEPETRKPWRGLPVVLTASLAAIALGVWFKVKSGRPEAGTPASAPETSPREAGEASARNRANLESRRGFTASEMEGAFVPEEVPIDLQRELAIQELQDRRVSLRTKISAERNSPEELQLKAEREADYRAAFAQLGMQEPTQRLRLSRLDDVRQLEKEFAQSLLAAAKAQAEYDQWIRSVLSPEQYAHYRAFEENASVRAELRATEAFAATNQIPIAPASFAGVERFLAEQQALTIRNSFTARGVNGGPYQGFDQTISGVENSLAAQRDFTLGEIEFISIPSWERGARMMERAGLTNEAAQVRQQRGRGGSDPWTSSPP